MFAATPVKFCICLFWARWGLRRVSGLSLARIIVRASRWTRALSNVYTRERSAEREREREVARRCTVGCCWCSNFKSRRAQIVRHTVFISFSPFFLNSFTMHRCWYSNTYMYVHVAPKEGLICRFSCVMCAHACVSRGEMLLKERKCFSYTPETRKRREKIALVSLWGKTVWVDVYVYTWYVLLG